MPVVTKTKRVTAERHAIEASVNVSIEDALIRHGVFIERYGNGRVRELIGWLNSGPFARLLRTTESRLGRMKSRGFGSGIFGTSAYTGLMGKAQEIIGGAFDGLFGRISDELYDFARAEARFSLNVMGRELPFDFTGLMPKRAEFRRMLFGEPYAGATMKERVNGLGKATTQRFERAVNTGLVSGETTEQIMARVRGTQAARYTDGVLGWARRQVETEVHTAVNHAGNGGRALAHSANGAVVQQEKWVAVLDERTCEACGALDGQTFDAGEGPYPPEHEGCRCFRGPVLKSASELGFGKDELPEAQRRALDGKVPEKTTFAQWIKGQPAKIQDDVLGPTRGRLFRSGQIPLDRFINDKRQVIDLKTLAKREGFDLDAEQKTTRREAAEKARETRESAAISPARKTKDMWRFRSVDIEGANREIDAARFGLEVAEKSGSRLAINRAREQLDAANESMIQKVSGLSERATKAAFDMREEFGDKFIMTNPNSPDTMLNTVDLSEVPTSIRQKLREAGVTIEASDLYSPKMMGGKYKFLDDIQARGYPKGETYRGVPGMYYPKDKFVGAGKDAFLGDHSTMMHEIGHAMQDNYITAKETYGFMSLWARKLGTSGKWLNPYYDQPGLGSSGWRVGGEEAFADLFSWTISKTRAEIVSAWGEEAADWMKKYVKRFQ